MTAVLLGLLAARVPAPGPRVRTRALVLAAACWLAVCAVPLIFTDLAVSRLPDPLTAAAYAGTAVLLVLAAAAGARPSHAASWSALAGPCSAGSRWPAATCS